MKPGYVIEPVVPAEDRRTTPERRRSPERRAAVREVQQLVRVHAITDEELAAIAAELAQEQ